MSLFWAISKVCTARLPALASYEKSPRKTLLQERRLEIETALGLDVDAYVSRKNYL